MATRARSWRLAAMWAAIAVLQVWFWLRLLTSGGYLAHSDLYEQFLPVFLSPIARWSSAEFGGLPVFADPQNTTWYPLHFLFARIVGSWSWYIVSAYVVAALGAGAYAWQITKSRFAAVVAALAWPWSEALADLFPHLAMLHGFAWLPWVLFGVDKIVETTGARWIALTAFAFACLAVSGHPQVSVYGGYLIALYAASAWLFDSRRVRPLLALGFAFGLGVALAAIQVVPTMEAAGWIARDRVNFSQFADSFAKKPHELLTVVIPQFCHERREAPSYVGLLPLWLSLVAIAGAWRQWRTWFWVAIAIVCLLLGLGSATPLAEMAFDLPLYDKFRVGARHLALYSFAVIALAAIAAGALAHGRLRWRGTTAALVVAGGATLAALRFVAARPDLFDFSCDGHGFGRLVPTIATDVRVQGAIALVGGLLVLVALARRARPFALAALAVLLGFDLLNAQSEPVDWHGYDAPTIISPALLQPSVHAARLRDFIAPLDQRLLPLEGSALDPVVPGAFSRVWRIPSLGGYNPLLPGRLTRLAQMDANGAARGRLLIPEDEVTDLFAVRVVIVPGDQAAPAPALSLDAPLGTLPSLDIVMGPSDCRPKAPIRVTLAPAAPVDATAIVLKAVMRCGDNVRGREMLGTVTVVDADGQPRVLPITPGPGSTARIEVPLPDDAKGAGGTIGDRAVPLGGRVKVREVRVETAAMPAWLYVDGLALVDAARQVWPMSLPASAVAVSRRWREQARFRTSRDSDRGRDEDAPHEQAVVVYENLRARPRAWWVGRAIEVADEEAVDVLRFGVLRSGERFDVAREAFLPPGEGPRLGGVAGQSGRVEVNHAGDGVFALTVDAPSAGIVVVSELHHPGWRAQVDGRSAAALRVDHAVLGVNVPAGTHHVTLEFAPASFRLGAGISATAVAVLAGCLVWPLRRRGAGSRHREDS